MTKKSAANIALCTACLLLTAIATAQSTNLTRPWRYAVIFHLTNGARTYAGVSAVMSVSAQIQSLEAAEHETSAPAVIPRAGDDIWLAGNGTTRELFLDTKAGTIRFVDGGRLVRGRRTIRFVNGAHLSAPIRDHGLFAAVVQWERPFIQPVDFGKAAHGATAGQGIAGNVPRHGNAVRLVSDQAGVRSMRGNSTTVAVGSAQMREPSQSLVQMVANAHIVVAGRVVAVLREQHDPENDTGMQMSTVFLVAVERYLESPGSGAPQIIKVTMAGGDLPWSENGSSGAGYRDLDTQMLTPGSRYIMFLNICSRPRSAELQRGYFAQMSGGVWSRSSEFDECGFSEVWRGQVLLSKGMAVSVPLPATPAGYTWSFDDGEHLVGLPESIAVAEIIRAVHASELRDAALQARIEAEYHNPLDTGHRDTGPR